MIIIEIIVIICLIVVNGYFAMAEIALISVKRSRLRFLIQKGDKRAKETLFLVRQSREMLSTIQVAITVIGIFAGAFGGATIAKHIEIWLSNFTFFTGYEMSLSIILVVIPITYFSLVIGELVPKQIALSNSEKTALSVTGSIILLMKITRPLVNLLSFSTLLFLKFLRIKPISEQIISEDEIKLLIAEGTDVGIFEREEQKIIENVFRLGNRPIMDYMTMKEDIVWLDINDSPSEIRKKISDDERSVFPVYEKDISRIVGAIETNDFLIHLLENGREQMDLKTLIQPVMFIEKNVPSLVAIDRLKKSFISIALITEKESKDVIGLISFHDILEAIVGEFYIEQ